MLSDTSPGVDYLWPCLFYETHARYRGITFRFLLSDLWYRFLVHVFAFFSVITGGREYSLTIEIISATTVCPNDATKLKNGEVLGLRTAAVQQRARRAHGHSHGQEHDKEGVHVRERHLAHGRVKDDLILSPSQRGADREGASAVESAVLDVSVLAS